VDPLTVQYSMYAMVCHSGVLGGGHYVSYSKTESKKWFCHNDSSCKEVPEGSIDKSSAYILMYEREGLSMEDYMPDTSNLSKDTGDLDEEFDLDFKKQCSLMWDLKEIENTLWFKPSMSDSREILLGAGQKFVRDWSELNILLFIDLYSLNIRWRLQVQF